MSGITYLPFFPWRSAREYQGQSGSEVGGLRLPAYVTESLAATKLRGLPEQYTIKGETTTPDGRRFLDFAVTTEYIEKVTDFRYDAGQRKLRLRCPLCLFWDGKHRKGCEG
jgi:hypothetical protein